MNLQFTKFAAMPEEVIEKYASKVPDELVELWKQYGLGFLLDGYLKIINPEEYVEFVQKTYFRGANNDFDVMTKRMDHFIKFLDDDSFLEDFFDIPFYEEVVKEYGSLDYNQCFGFVPLLVLGGKRDLTNIDKVGIKEHLDLITQITGGVGFEN